MKLTKCCNCYFFFSFTSANDERLFSFVPLSARQLCIHKQAIFSASAFSATHSAIYLLRNSCTKQVKSLMNWHTGLDGCIGIVMLVKEIHRLSYIHRNNRFLYD